MIRKNLKEISTNLWEIKPYNGMLIPARFYATKEDLAQLFNDNALNQLVNVAKLPGVSQYALAMPDIHWGYGFPIGGVAAMDTETGYISPGGVGYDINCGVRLISTNLDFNQIKAKIKDVVNAIYNNVPTGVGSSNAIKQLNQSEMRSVLQDGASWAIQNGFGSDNDLQFTEEQGKIASANPDFVSNKAFKRGANQLGTLGSGNHFLEIAIVKELFDTDIASQFGLFKDQIIVMIHTGSRGLGHQVCDDYVHEMLMDSNKLGFKLPDRQLTCAAINSKEGKRYFAAMSAAANFAWANRQIIMHNSEKAIASALGKHLKDIQFHLIYDVCHNIAKFENHMIDGNVRRVCVHRKGATRAFDAKAMSQHPVFSKTGQPVVIPGDMASESYLCVGSEKAMSKTFGSSCHGAGRTMSRHKALKSLTINDKKHSLNSKNIEVIAAKNRTLIEEASPAYKNVGNVVNTMVDSGIIKKVIRSIPIGVIKG